MEQEQNGLGVFGYNNTHAVSFDGTNDYIDTGATFQSTFRGSFSFSFWMKSPSGSTLDNNAALFATWHDDDEDYVQFYNKAGKLTLTFFANNDGHRQTADSATFSGTNGAAGTNDAWWHIACVVTKASSGDTGFSTVMYKNGSVIASTLFTGSVSATNQAAYTNDKNLYIGARNIDATADSFSEVIIDDFALFNVALDADAVSAIYNSGVPTDLLSNSGNYDNSGDLVAYYKLNEGSGTTATDATGGSDGTLTNGAAYSTDIPS